MGAGPSIPADTHVVIVGGGYGGTRLAYLLKKAGGKFTLIDRKDCWHHIVGSPRAMVEEGAAETMHIAYKDIVGDSFVQGTVVKIDPQKQEVSLDDSRAVSYDVLVIATGSNVRFPASTGNMNKAESVAAYVEFRDKIVSSQKIVVVGGGPVGVEIATEIANDFPDKKVTIVHSRDWLLLQDLNAKFQKRMKEIIKSLGVELVLEEKVSNLADLPSPGGPATVVTDKGTSIEADLVINCTGAPKVNSEAYENGLGASMNERGELKVNEFLQVEGQENIYAIGDCTDLKETKLAYLTDKHVTVLFQTLKNRSNNKPPKAYKPDDKPFVLTITLGRCNALGQLKNGFLLPEFFIKRVRAKDAMIQHFYNEYGVKMPTRKK